MALSVGDSSDASSARFGWSGAGDESLAGPLTRWAELAGADASFAFVDYTVDRDGIQHTLTWAELDRRTGAVAAALQQVAGRGERAAILAPQSLEYVVAFLGAVRAGLTAVPLFGPDLPGHAGRLGAVLADCDPSCVLATGAGRESVGKFLAEHGTSPAVVVVDEVPEAMADRFVPVEMGAEDAAYLQYTSGSTRTPAGVVITHGNSLANARQALHAFDAHRDRSATVCWLPLYHDMGLLLSVIAPLVAGLKSVIMDPMAFVQRPVRWLRLLSDNPGALSAAPNFAYEHCSRRVRDQDKVGLVLDSISGLINGSEPVRPETVARFAEAFAGAGLRPEVHRPCYGLAEATVFVAASPVRPPVTAAFDRDVLAGGTALRVDLGAEPGREASELASCGQPIHQHVAIVDPNTSRLRSDDQVGEIWVHGPNVGRGIWNQPEASARTFGATIDGDPGGLPTGPWLRTGDLGVIHDGELYVTGRIKDMIIIDGRNHYPQDLEATVEEVHPAVRGGTVAAFSVPTDEGEGVVVVAGRAPVTNGFDPRTLATDVRRALSAAHGVTLQDFVLVAPGAVPRTSSGKVARGACRGRYLEGALTTSEGAA